MPNNWTFVAGGGFTLATDVDPYTYWVVAIDSRPHPGAFEIVLSAVDPADEPGVVFFMSRDGRSRWQVNVDATDVHIKQFLFGVQISTASLGVHNIAAGSEFYIGVRLVNNIVFVAVGNSLVAEVTFTFTIPSTPADALVEHNAWGFASIRNGCRVLAANLYHLTPRNASRAEVLVIVCGGFLYECSDPAGELLSQVPGRVADAVGPVGIAEYNGEALIVGGGLANSYDPILRAISPWSDQDHDGALIAGGTMSTLPGAEQPTALDPTRGRGTTKATIIAVNNNRVSLSGYSERPEVVFQSASDNRNSYRLLNIDLGEATAYTINAQDSVTCLAGLATNNLFIGGKNSQRMHLGDPLWGQVVTPQVADKGVSGQYAITRSEIVLAAVHGPAGLFGLPTNGALPVNISEPTLSEGIQVSPTEISNYYVSVVRDPNRGLVHIFITPVEDGAAFHFVYDEAGQQFQRGAGGFFCTQYPVSVGPTAAVFWRGEVLLGTRHGRVLTLVRGLTTDYDDGDIVPIESWMTLSLVADAHPAGDAIITSWRAVLSDGSDAINCRIYGGATAETLYDLATARILFSAAVEPFGAGYAEIVRSPAMALFLHNDGTVARYFELEDVLINVETGTMFTRARILEPGEPPVPAGPPGTAGAGGVPPSGGGSGPGGQPNLPGGNYGGGTPPGGGGVVGEF